MKALFWLLGRVLAVLLGKRHLHWLKHEAGGCLKKLLRDTKNRYSYINNNAATLIGLRLL